MESGKESVVYVPTSVTVVDADKKLIGTMGVVADQKIDGYSNQRAAAQRRANY